MTEDGGIRGTGSSCDYPLWPWVGGLGWVRRMCGLGFGRGVVALLDELVLLFLVVKTVILDRHIG